MTALSFSDMNSSLLMWEVHTFLALEARLLDEERYQEWLDLFTEDATYWMPGIENRSRSDHAGTYERERMAYFDDTKEDLRSRVIRLTAPTAWAEDPPTRHLHVVSNIEVEPALDPETWLVRSVFINYRGHQSIGAETVYGRRADLLRREGPGLRIAERTVILCHATLPAKNINTFF